MNNKASASRICAVALIGAMLSLFFSCSRAGTQAVSSPGPAQSGSAQSGAAQNEEKTCQACLEFNRLNTQVRDGAIDRADARAKIAGLLPQIKDYFYARGGKDSPPDEWIFPIEGYGRAAIGGVKGEGYVAKGYDYFDGNRHGGHPAHDIFIRDRNQDGMDDATKRAVSALAMRNAVVVASEESWEAGSELRGGKYLYLYDPSTESLLYYAHNGELLVRPGDLVEAGSTIARIGRTGKNAFASRSPTHLHIMLLVIEDGYPRPKDLYQILLRAAKGR